MNRHVQKLLVVFVGLLLVTGTLVIAVSAAGNTGNGARISPQAAGSAASPSASPEASPGASPQASPVAPAVVAVAIRGFQFDPPVAEVAIGGTVTWTNDDFIAHDVTSTPDDSKFRSPILGTGQTFSFTFEDAGSYDYFCSIHPYMVGKVVVVEP